MLEWPTLFIASPASEIMFSGIIAAVGRIDHVAPRNSGVRLTIDAGGLDLSDVALGDSIACNGVCLTVVELAPVGNPTAFIVDVSDETLRCATGLVAGAPLNLEKALRLAACTDEAAASLSELSWRTH